MSKYTVGVTERGDAGLDFTWEEKINSVDMAILITKNVNDKFIERVTNHLDKAMVHATITGHGGSIIEPNVPDLIASMMNTVKLADIISPEKVVIRVDPIFPLLNGIKTAKTVIFTFAGLGFKRFRVSVVDMYPHVRKNFIDAGITLPYGNNFHASKEQFSAVDAMLREVKYEFPDIRIESCAEPDLKETIKCGCVSSYDLALFRLYDTQNSGGYQRPDCLCYPGKRELLENRTPCPHGCLYCFWKPKHLK